MRLVGGAFFALLTAAIGCSSTEVTYDYDFDARFSDYRTFAWAPAPEAKSTRAREDIMEKRVKRAVEKALQEEGLTSDADRPDLRVAYTIRVRDRTRLTDWGYPYRDDYRVWDDRELDVYQYAEGTLIVDLVDAKTDRLVWRGAARRVVDEDATPEEVDRRVKESVKKMFAHFPPEKQ